MDFFEYYEITSMFISANAPWWVPIIIGALCFAAVYSFQAVALYVIGGREGYGNRWMAFVPFFNTYYIGVCAQRNRVFNKVDTKKLALAVAIFEAVLFTASLVNLIAEIQLYTNNCLYLETYATAFGNMQRYVVKEDIAAQFLWAKWCWDYLYDYCLRWLDLVYLVFDVMVLAMFFQTYSARRYMLFTITSILFPIQGILFFIIRNNRGMNYGEFIRGEQYRMYQQYNQQYRQQNFNNNPYNQNPYSNNSYNNPNPYSDNVNQPQSGGKTDDPFSEFGDSDKSADDPFSDFGDKN